MSIDNLNIKTKTSGFASPAEVYVTKRLDLHELIINDIFTTFYFRYSGSSVLGILEGDVLVIDKAIEAVVGDLVISASGSGFIVKEFSGEEEVWGKVTWILHRK